MKRIPVVACGIFRYELEKLRPELEQELGAELAVEYVSSGLDTNASKLEAALREATSRAGAGAALLYGCMCHPNMRELAEELGMPPPALASCRDMFVSKEDQERIAADGNVFFLTPGGLKLWRETYIEGHGWDEVDGRINFGGIDRIVVLDCGLFEYTDEDLFDFYEFTQTPVEVEQIDLSYFKRNALALLQAAKAAANDG